MINKVLKLRGDIEIFSKVSHNDDELTHNITGGWDVLYVTRYIIPPGTVK